MYVSSIARDEYFRRYARFVLTCIRFTSALQSQIDCPPNHPDSGSNLLPESSQAQCPWNKSWLARSTRCGLVLRQYKTDTSQRAYL